MVLLFTLFFVCFGINMILPIILLRWGLMIVENSTKCFFNLMRVISEDWEIMLA